MSSVGSATSSPLNETPSIPLGEGNGESGPSSIVSSGPIRIRCLFRTGLVDLVGDEETSDFCRFCDGFNLSRSVSASSIPSSGDLGANAIACNFRRYSCCWRLCGGVSGTRLGEELLRVRRRLFTETNSCGGIPVVLLCFSLWAGVGVAACSACVMSFLRPQAVDDRESEPMASPGEGGRDRGGALRSNQGLGFLVLDPEASKSGSISSWKRYFLVDLVAEDGPTAFGVSIGVCVEVSSVMSSCPRVRVESLFVEIFPASPVTSPAPPSLGVSEADASGGGTVDTGGGQSRPRREPLDVLEAEGKRSGVGGTSRLAGFPLVGADGSANPGGA